MKNKNLTKPLLFALAILILALIGQPTAYGYLHPADAMILLAALLLPTPAALISAGAASLLADLLKGYFLLAPITLIIKLLMVLLAKKLLSFPAAKNHPELMAAPAAVVPVAGFFLGELILGLFQGNAAEALSSAIGTLPKNLIQAGGSVLIFIFIFDIAMGFKAAKEKIRAEKEEKENE